MPIAVVIMLSDEGVVSVGEIDAAMVDPAELTEVDTLEDAFKAADTLILGEEAPPDVEEDAFSAAAEAPVRDFDMDEDD